MARNRLLQEDEIDLFVCTGITSMSVKDVVTSLVDDGLVDSEKIGSSLPG